MRHMKTADLGTWLRQQRQQRGWSRAELARQLQQAAGLTTLPATGILTAQIGGWERGETPTGRYLRLCCQAFGLTHVTLWPAHTVRADLLGVATWCELHVLLALCSPGALSSPVPPNRDIAAQLGVTPASVKTHLRRAGDKFGIPPGPHRRTRLASHMITTGLIQTAQAQPSAQPGQAESAPAPLARCSARPGC